MNKSEILQLLRRNTKIPRVSLPRDIDLTIEEGVLKVYINKTTENMQTNSVAFESWIIMLKSWIGNEIKSVELDFAVPENLSGHYGTPENGHYNRFLYRLNHLKRMYPNWFHLKKEKSIIVSEFMNWLESNTVLLNHSLKERQSVIQTNNMERKIESWFVFEEGKKLICDMWGIDPNQLYNQLPIGVFYQEIAAKNAVFTRGQSAIDLWGIGKQGETLHMIELKCGDNKGMGVISETLFYAAILHDTCIRKDEVFQFGTYQDTPKTRDKIAIQNNGNKFGSLSVHILSEKYHPLFDDKVVSLIKEGLSNFYINFDRATYDYEGKTIYNETKNL